MRRIPFAVVLRLVIATAALASPCAGRRPSAPADHPDTGQPAAGQPLSAGLLFHRPLDLDRATYDDLLALPGMGPAKARALLEKRRRIGHFSDADDLRGIPGLGAKTRARIAPLVSP